MLSVTVSAFELEVTTLLRNTNVYYYYINVLAHGSAAAVKPLDAVATSPRRHSSSTQVAE